MSPPSDSGDPNTLLGILLVIEIIQTIAISLLLILLIAVVWFKKLAPATTDRAGAERRTVVKECNRGMYDVVGAGGSEARK